MVSSFSLSGRQAGKVSAILLLGGLAVASLAAVQQTTVAEDVSRGQANTNPDGFRTTVAPFLQQHCVKCHGPEKQKGKLTLHAIDGDLLNGKDIEKWKTVAERLTLGEMPPESEKRPDAQKTEQVVAWIKAELTKAGVAASDADRKLLLPGHGNRVDHFTLFSGRITGPAASPARLWRMSPQLYTTFVPRVGGRNAKVGQAFSTASGEGFKDYADLFAIDEPTVGQLIRNARQIAEAQCGLVRFSQPVKEFKPLVDPQHTPTEAEIQAALRKQFQMALQRELTADEMQRLVAMMQKNIKDAGPAIGARDTLATVLLLPEAMYRFELGQGKPDAHGRVLLTPRELAYAIAFALTDDGPDATLLKAAQSGKLAGAEDVRREVQRLLDDRKIAKPRITRFFEEYFEHPAALDVFKDLSRGQWRPEILVNDTRLLIQYILDRDKDVLKELLTTNKSYVNYRVGPKGVAEPARIANKKDDKPRDPKKPAPVRQLEYSDLYNLPPDWEWTDKQPLELPKEQRAGILTQPSWLAAFATNNENHAIRRGKWVRERLLGGVVPDLPITVDAQLPDKPEQTLRQRMEITRQEYCWQCHQKMNPLGLTFEVFDYLGRHRKTESVVDAKVPPKPNPKKGEPPIPTYHDVPVDATGAVEHSGDPKIDGEVKNAVELIHKLADSPRVRQVFVRHAFRFWMGRNETLADAPTLLAADKAYVESGGSMKALIVALLTSDSFLYRANGK